MRRAHLPTFLVVSIVLTAPGAALRAVRAQPPSPTSAAPIALSDRLEAARGHGRRAWRLQPDRPGAAAVAGRIDGELVILSADAGEFSGDWTDPAVVQRALFVVVEGLRRLDPTLDPHFVVALSTFTVEAPAALYLPLANDVRGIGWQHFEPAETFRFTPGRLDGVLFMNSARAADTPLAEALFLQEIGHRWGVYVRLPDPDGTRLLGRDCAHWNHHLRTAGSAMEGNPWVEAGAGRFAAAVPPTVGYDPAQLYLMGAVPAEAVPPLTLVSAAGGPCFAAQVEGLPNPRHRPPTWRSGVPAEVDGVAEMVPWDAVIAHEGPRRPAHPAARRGWSAVFVLLTRAADDPATAIPLVDAARRRWSAAFERATDGRLALHTRRVAAALDPAPGSVGFGGRCLDPLDCAADWPHCAPTASGDRICTAGCLDHADCGDGACCAAVGDAALCAPAVDPCPAVDPDPNGGADGGAVDADVAGATDGSSDAPTDPTHDAAQDAGPRARDAGVERDDARGCTQRPGRQPPVGWLGALALALLTARRRLAPGGR